MMFHSGESESHVDIRCRAVPGNTLFPDVDEVRIDTLILRIRDYQLVELRILLAKVVFDFPTS